MRGNLVTVPWLPNCRRTSESNRNRHFRLLTDPVAAQDPRESCWGSMNIPDPALGPPATMILFRPLPGLLLVSRSKLEALPRGSEQCLSPAHGNGSG